MLLDIFFDLFFRPALKVTEFGLEIDADAEDTPGIGERLRDIPEYAFADVAIIPEKRQEGQDDARYNHGDGRAILNPIFFVH